MPGGERGQDCEPSHENSKGRRALPTPPIWVPIETEIFLLPEERLSFFRPALQGFRPFAHSEPDAANGHYDEYPHLTRESKGNGKAKNP